MGPIDGVVEGTIDCVVAGRIAGEERGTAVLVITGAGDVDRARLGIAPTV